MGDPKKPKKQYTNPKKRWDKGRIAAEKKLLETYGLKNKRELRKAETLLRKKRQNARHLLALPTEERKRREQELLTSLHTLGLLPQEATLDDVLGLKPESLLERRLQTMSWRKGLAQTPKQARQFIVHGHIGVNKTKINAPGYLVRRQDETNIAFFKKPLQLAPPKEEAETAKEDLKKQFEESIAAPIPEGNAPPTADPPSPEENAPERVEKEDGKNKEGGTVNA